MKRHTIEIVGLGDSCARSHNVMMSLEDDPEIEFEAALLSALEDSSAEVAEVDVLC